MGLASCAWGVPVVGAQLELQGRFSGGSDHLELPQTTQSRGAPPVIPKHTGCGIGLCGPCKSRTFSVAALSQLGYDDRCRVCDSPPRHIAILAHTSLLWGLCLSPSPLR